MVHISMAEIAQSVAIQPWAAFSRLSGLMVTDALEEKGPLAGLPPIHGRCHVPDQGRGASCSKSWPNVDPFQALDLRDTNV